METEKRWHASRSSHKYVRAGVVEMHGSTRVPPYRSGGQIYGIMKNLLQESISVSGSVTQRALQETSAVLPMIPYGGHRVEETRPKCPECRTRGYRVEANKNEIYYNHGLWHGLFTEAEDDVNANVTCETCGKQFKTTQDLVQHEKDEHSGEAVEALERLYQANLPILTESSRKAFLSTCPACGDEGEEVKIKGSKHSGDYHRHYDGEWHGPHKKDENESLNEALIPIFEYFDGVRQHALLHGIRNPAGLLEFMISKGIFEETPPGHENMVQGLKKHAPGVNPWAVAWSHYNKYGKRGKYGDLKGESLTEDPDPDWDWGKEVKPSNATGGGAALGAAVGGYKGYKAGRAAGQSRPRAALTPSEELQVGVMSVDLRVLVQIVWVSWSGRPSPMTMAMAMTRSQDRRCLMVQDLISAITAVPNLMTILMTDQENVLTVHPTRSFPR
jgi:hypothetical protein